MKCARILFGFGMFLILAVSAFGAVPKLINFQGVVKDSAGNTPAVDMLGVTFTIYDAPLGGVALWTETQSITIVAGGLFSVLLGSTNPIPDSVFADTVRWLGIKVETDPEMLPRQQLVSVGYAYRVNSVDGALGGTINGAIDAPGMSSKIRFHYNDVSEFPSAATYHGMFAHAHNQGAAYYAHAAQWVRLADSAHPHSSLAASDLSPNPALSVDADGRVGIGTATPSAQLEVLNSASSSSTLQGVSGIVSNASTGSAFGGIFTASSAGSGIKSGVRGNASSASANPAYGVYGEADNASTGDAYGGYFNVPFSGGSGNAYGVYSSVASPSGWGFYTPNNAYVGGKVGIGTSSPLHMMHIQTSGDARLRVEQTGNSFAGVLAVNSQHNYFMGVAGIGDGDASMWHLYDNTAGAQRIAVKSDGKVGIGTTSPAAKLDVNGTVALRGTTGLNDNPLNLRTVADVCHQLGWSSPPERIFFKSCNSPVVLQEDQGNVGIGTKTPTEKLHVIGNICATGTIGACSDVRFKRDVRPVDGSLDKIEKLQGVTYRWKREEYPQFAEGDQIGFVAQEVKEILPEVVSEGSDGTLSVDYGRFSVLLLEAIKEQQKEIKELKTAIEKLQIERR